VSRGAAAIEERVRSPGYTPARRDVGRVFELLASASDGVARHALRALAQLGPSAAPIVMQRFDRARAPERARLVALLGRIARDGEDGALVQWLVQRLADADPMVKRRAIAALGKIGGSGTEAALISAWDQGLAPPELRALVAALGNAGEGRALARLSQVAGNDPELGRVVREARTKIERTLLRKAPGTIDGTREFPRPVSILLHVRAGLEDILQEELGRDARGRVVGPGRVQIVSSEPLERLFRARTFLHFGFPLPPEAVRDDDAECAVVRALSSDAAWEILSAVAVPPIRYRIEWASAGRRKAATFRVAQRVRDARPGLVNDATAAPWEAVVTERASHSRRRVFVELWPRALSDPRFSYRSRTLPASSHPTIAAALAHVAGVVPTDIVWDPFVGSGIELCERALLGPYAQLVGSDVDAAALDAARENLEHAGALRVRIEKGDARTYRPTATPSLIITNPPFGRRVLDRGGLLPLFRAFLANAGEALSPSGRLVWVSPFGDVTAELAEISGLVVRMRRPVDVGGVPGEIQMFVRGPRKPSLP
jgi:23S rRNA G2445 N2-methylase RlmL